jgi:uncharacterized protein (TIGR02246 family)
MTQGAPTTKEEVRMAIDAQITSTIQNLSQNFADAFKRGDFAAVGALFAEDAVMLPPGSESIVGRSNIQLFWGRSRRIRELRFEPTNVKLLGGDAVREMGVLQIRVMGVRQQKAREVAGKYAFVWEKIGGEWKLETCMWNRNGGNQAERGNVQRGRVGRQGGGRGQGEGGRGGQGGGQGGGRGGRGGGTGRSPAPFVPRIDD